MAGLNLLIVLAVILIGVPIWALIWGQQERRAQNTYEDLAKVPVSILSRVDPKGRGRDRQ
jgi:hypothetical protein